MGIEYVPPRSTLSDGNRDRPSDIFKKTYEHLYKLYKPSLSDSTLPKAIVQKLFLLDATVFSLFKAILKTSGRYSANGKKKGGIKKNTVIEASSMMPYFIQFDATADHDQMIYNHLSLPVGSYIVFDKGYNKENAVYTSLIECIHGEGSPTAILKEQFILQQYKDENNAQQTLRLRRIAWWDADKKRAFEFITNEFELEAITIAQLYKYRWQIELFFKKLKQNFPIQYFVGDNQNAIEIQIWCALIALLLLSAIHCQQKSKMAFSVYVSIIRLHLFSYIGIKLLLEHYRKNKPTNSPDLFNSG